MLTIEYAGSYGASIQTARRLTDAEKTHYNNEWKEKIFIGTSDEIKLDHIKWSDLPKRAPDGAFNGCSNRVWIITDAEREDFIQINNTRKKEAEKAEITEEIKDIELAIKRAEGQKDLPTRSEAQRRMEAYNNLYNEGCEGFVPHIYSRDEYDAMKKRIDVLRIKIQGRRER